MSRIDFMYFKFQPHLIKPALMDFWSLVERSAKDFKFFENRVLFKSTLELKTQLSKPNSYSQKSSTLRRRWKISKKEEKSYKKVSIKNSSAS